jgi:hypothetical protein
LTGDDWNSEFRQAIVELEQVTGRMVSVDPGDFARIEETLLERLVVVQRVSDCAARMAQSKAEFDMGLLANLERAVSDGDEAFLRITLVREKARLDFKDLNRQLEILRSIRGAYGSRARLSCWDDRDATSLPARL